MTHQPTLHIINAFYLLYLNPNLVIMAEHKLLIIEGRHDLKLAGPQVHEPCQRVNVHVSSTISKADHSQ